jgi:hypothetical protein
MKRKKLTKRGSRRLFTKTAMKIHSLNSKIDNCRGGIRL